MNNRYKIVIWSKDIYREYILSDSETTIVKIGTTKGCQVRFNRERFFEDFEFKILMAEGSWKLIDGENVYFTTDGIMKLHTKELQYGDEILVKYENFNGELFKLNFFIDFDTVERKYNRIINLDNINKLTIGSNEIDNIYISDPLFNIGNVELTLKDGKFYIQDNNTKYGLYVNTEKIDEVKELKEYDFFTIVGYYFYFKENKLYTDIYENVRINGLIYEDLYSNNKMNYPKFNRKSRIKYIVPNSEIEVLMPDQEPQKPKENLVMTLIPALAMLGVTVVLRGMMGGGSSFVLYSVATMSIGILMSIMTAIVSKKEYKKEVKERKKVYLEYIEEKEKHIQESRKKEEDILNKLYKPIDENIYNLESFNQELFDRDIGDEDFLDIRLGEGKILAPCKIKYKADEFKNTKDKLRELPAGIEEKYRYISNGPIISKLKKANSIGVVGEHEELCDFINTLTIDIISRQFYKDVKLFYIFDEEDIKSFSWLRWIKHVQNDNLGIRNLIYDEESKNILFEYIFIELGRRKDNLKDNSENKKVTNEHFIIFIIDYKGIANHPISKYIKNASDYGVTFIFLNKYEELLPKGCTEIIKFNEDNSISKIECNNGEEIEEFTCKSLSNLDFNEIALRLAAVYIDDVSLESQLTKTISLFELLNIVNVDEIDLEKRWTESMIYKSMAAPLGVKTKNKVIYLDLNEKNHGPHGLVAGTTGSGKSEIIQTYILSMATIFHPYDVGFVIIDFKGGGMVNQFKDLPHLMGAITNIDGREITRSLLSIKAELRKRQELFSLAGVNHIDAYIKKFKNAEVETPMPHLILIVDEFAELKSDQPEFMKELISAARIGRSLGVHLILATQKPSGVIDEQIWSNSKFKLCLKVQNQQDSKEVIKTPLAAEIKEPGRAYLQVGNNEIFELFQSAYSGAPAINDYIGNTKEFEISEVSPWGKRKLAFKQEKKKNRESDETQLEAIVDYVSSYCIEKNIERLNGICLPPLPENILLEDIEKIEKSDLEIKIPIGIYDDPTHQLQDKVILNISENNLFIVGSSQFGKTSLLQTIIRTTTEIYTPNEVNIYILDFASMILRNFDELNHVGGVITSSEDEKLKTFMKMMKSEINKRREVLSDLGISSFISYKEAGYRELPQIIILIDNFTALKELYPEYEEILLNVCRDGVAVGIVMIIANSQTNGVGFKYMSNFGRRVALYCNDTGEYGSMFDRCRMQPKNVPGRALISIDKVVYEYQNYLAFSGDKEIDRVQNMRKFINEINAINRYERARRIPEIPKVLTREYLNNNYNTKVLSKNNIILGLNYESIDLEILDMEKIGSLSLIGKIGKAQNKVIENLINGVQASIMTYPTIVYAVDNIEKDYRFLDDFGFVEKYSILYSEFTSIIEEVYEELIVRQRKVLEYGIESLEREPLIIIICNNMDAVNDASSNKSVMDMYKKIMKQYRNYKVSFIFSNIENETIGFNAPELLKLIKEDKNAILFDDLNQNKVFDIPLNVVRNFKKELGDDDVYKIEGSEIKKVKILV